MNYLLSQSRQPPDACTGSLHPCYPLSLYRWYVQTDYGGGLDENDIAKVLLFKEICKLLTQKYTNYDHFHLFLPSRGAIICQYLLLFGTRIGHLSFEPPAPVPAHRLHLFRRTIVPDYHIAHRCFHSPSRRPRPLATLKESVAQNERPYRNTERFCLSIFHFVKYPSFK